MTGLTILFLDALASLESVMLCDSQNYVVWLTQRGRQFFLRYWTNELTSLSTLQPYNLTTLQPYKLTTLQLYIFTTLQAYKLTTLQPLRWYNLTTLQPHNLTTFQPYNQSKQSNQSNQSFFRPELEQKTHLFTQIVIQSTGDRICVIKTRTISIHYDCQRSLFQI